MRKVIIPMETFPRDRRFKFWGKELETVDTNRSNGYAFIGEWLPKEGKAELPVGSYVLWYHEEGSQKYHEPVIELYLVTKDGPDLIQTWECAARQGWALECRDEIADIIHERPEENPLSEFSDEELLTEIKRRGLLT